jgi:hypothetical protein
MDNETPLVKGGQGRSGSELVRAVHIGASLGVVAGAFGAGLVAGIAGVVIAVVWFVLGWSERGDESAGDAYCRGRDDERARVMAGLAAIGERARS